jgi:hypothetical protein
MAPHDGETESDSDERLSPGEAAFRRLRQREAARVGDKAEARSSAVAAETAGPADPAPSGPQASAEGGTASADQAAGTAGAVAETTAGVPDQPANIVAATAPSDPPPAAIADEQTSPPPLAIDVAAATTPAPAKESEALNAAGSGASAATPSADPGGREPEGGPAVTAGDESPFQRGTTAEADALEAALVAQLRSLEATLERPARLPRATPLRPPSPELAAEPAHGPPRRSPFAPDPVRQRTYVDLKAPPPSPIDDETEAPWRKYLAGPAATPRGGDAGPGRDRADPGVALALPALLRRPGAGAPEGRPEGGGLRALAVAALLGLGVGLGLVVVIRPFAGPAATPIATAQPQEPPDAADTAAPGGAGGSVKQALATLLADPPPVAALPATITDRAAGPVGGRRGNLPPAAAAPVTIRPPHIPDFDAAREEESPLAYVPAIPPYDPVSTSLLATGDADADAETRPAPRQPLPAGRARINTDVKLRAGPDNAAPVIAILGRGLEVGVLGCDYWCEITAGGKRGYVFRKFLTR